MSDHDPPDNINGDDSEDSTEQLLRADIGKYVWVLSPRERDLITLRFGLKDGKQRSLEAIAHLYGSTREQVRKLEKQALLKLKRQADSEE